ncbi:DUF2790 domain-containing protein [Pseudomonas sp. S3E12]|uniref:DUF2790 domain-containing protein n=1 Tax=Pseudomonas sp. S3E12 TaxID=1873126 RepID=UPI0009F510D2|nr:DUF2790 domain-containing protein [Pseudomonas sp. S3E12]
MKELLFTAPIIFSTGYAMAAEPTNNSTWVTQPYRYGTQLDIAKMISVSRSRNNCQAGGHPAHCLRRSQGVEHAIRYDVMYNSEGVTGDIIYMAWPAYWEHPIRQP